MIRIKKGIYEEQWRQIDVSSERLDESIDFICANNIESIHICDLYYEARDIEFLKKCSSVKEVNLNSYILEDISAIYEMKNLKSIIINETPIPIDLSKIEGLEYVAADYKGIINIENSINLKSLYLTNYKPNPKCFNIDNLTNLENLEISYSNLSSLKGIEKLQNLKSLSLSYFKNLTDVNDIQYIDSLVMLRIEDSKKIKNLDVIQNLKKLKHLALCNDKELQTISFIKNLKLLDSCILVGTTILDGDMSYCMDIKHVEFDNKKHYSHRNEEFSKSNDIIEHL